MVVHCKLKTAEHGSALNVKNSYILLIEKNIQRKYQINNNTAFYFRSQLSIH